MTIYHIAFRADWDAARAAGEYLVSTRGRTLAQQGFIHAATAGQVAGVAEAFYADVGTGPDTGTDTDADTDTGLVVLAIDPDRLTAPLRYEPVPDAAEPFPHIYGPLNVDAVIGLFELGRDAQGRYVFEA